MSNPLPRFLRYSLAAALPALGLLIGGLSAPAGASTHPTAQAQAQAQALAVAKAAIKQLTLGQHPGNFRVHSFPGHPISALTSVESTNWSGYADTGSSFSKATASWTEPSASCSRGTSLAAFWVGIDGFTSDSVEQDGTLIECSGGRAFQFSWWEMFPTNAVQVVGETVAAGDSISASVVRTGTSYKLSVTDSSHSANSFTTTQSCSSCANSSAEWIAEAPSSSSGIEPLAHFSTFTASNATVTEGSTSGVISSFTDDEITMIDNSGAVKAQPSALNSGGNGFSVTWERAN